MKELIALQNELKAPKGNFNSFGKYKYRSCEDILESVKPLLKKYSLQLTISDELQNIGERYYVKATATLTNGEEVICNTAYAREELEKKGMDGSQITGTASSYARKYALNGLFLIDDTKDADTNEYHEQTTKEVRCEGCGRPITSVTKRDGSKWEVSEMAEYSKEMYGKPLCGECMKAAEKRRRDEDKKLQVDS